MLTEKNSYEISIDNIVEHGDRGFIPSIGKAGERGKKMGNSRLCSLHKQVQSQKMLSGKHKKQKGNYNVN